MIAKQDILEYADLVAEIGELKREIEKREREGLSDVVSASCPDAPYLQRSVTVRGRGSAAGLRLRLVGESERLEQKRAEIEAFAEGLARSSQRRIVRMRMEGLTWGDIAARMGHRYSVDSVRKIFERCFQKN